MPRLAIVMAFVSTCCLAGENPLIDAIKDQDRKAAIALIEARTDVNAALPDGSTPLAWAAYEGDAEIVESLLKAGAKPNAANEYGETPLTLACATISLTGPPGDICWRGPAPTRTPLKPSASPSGYRPTKPCARISAASFQSCSRIKGDSTCVDGSGPNRSDAMGVSLKPRRRKRVFRARAP